MLRSSFTSLRYAVTRFLNTRFQLFGTPSLSPVSFEKQVVDEAVHCRLPDPVTLDRALHWKFRQRKEIHFPETFVTEMHDARVWGNQGAVITRENRLFTSVSREFEYGGEHHSIFKQRRIVPPEPLEGRIAVIAASGNEVYYHWMFDIIPRLDLLARSGMLANVDRFILNYRSLPFQLEVLALAGLSERKIIAATDHWNFHKSVQTLVVPSLVSPNDCPSAQSCAYIRNLFAACRSTRRPFRKLYLQRTKGRTLLNEPDIMHILRQEGFEPVHPETMTIAMQARLFSEASYIVAPHGAGLTNIVFCEPGTKIIDLFSPEWVNPCYWILSSHLSLRYGYLVGEGKVVPEGVDPKNKAAHISIDAAKLKKLLQLMEQA